jgi:glycosyltransferase involved in cell wall biosynthesis/SAM-dependent methyltransferase
MKIKIKGTKFKILLYVPGMSFDGNTLDQGNSLGGSESMGFYIGKELAKRGHYVFIFSNVPDGRPKKIDNVFYMPIGESNKKYPFGQDFQIYALNVPFDVIIAQRAQGIFGYKFNSKLNYWWSHDLALKRYSNLISAMSWNVDKFLAVSNFHKKQIIDIYGISEDFVGILPNGIDLSLFESSDPQKKFKSKVLFYSHRPERGLMNLVKKQGIMEELYKLDPTIKLIISTYDFKGSMVKEHEYLKRLAQELLNVQDVGNLSKKDLHQAMSNVALHVYPTDFEEVSCITAMEEQASGTPFISTEVGALPETLNEGGVFFSKKDSFVKNISYLLNDYKAWHILHTKALKKAQDYDLKKSCDLLEDYIDESFRQLTKNKSNLYHFFIWNNDIGAVKKLVEKEQLKEKKHDTIINEVLKDPINFYNKVAEYNVKIGNNHNLGNYDYFFKVKKLEPIFKILSKLPSKAKVLDYGCCVGQVTFGMAHVRPDVEFNGVDISELQIEIGNKYKEKNNITNVRLGTCSEPSHLKNLGQYDLVLCIDVLEHVYDYYKFLIDLEKLCKLGGLIVISTPLGPFEKSRTEHLHNFEELDIKSIAGHMDEFAMLYVGERDNKRQEKLGHIIWSWKYNPEKILGKIDYDRKLKVQRPNQLISLCMIVHKDGDALAKTLKSIHNYMDEIIIGIDCKGSIEKTIAYEVGTRFGAKMFQLKDSPTVVGFDVVRNQTIERATKDWIIWLDDDEIYSWPENTVKFLQYNQYDSYAVSQHHHSADPPGMLKTDHPCRIFRNNKNIKFYGVVHEHPETGINRGAGRVFILPRLEGSVSHIGYETEEVRRVRFERNWPLMERDHKKYPERLLGQFLYIRDLSLLNKFTYEQMGGNIHPTMIKRARIAIELWRKLLGKTPFRLIFDSMPFVSECVDMVTNHRGIHFKLALDINTHGFGDNINGTIPKFVEGKVEQKEDLLKIVSQLAKEKISPFENCKYL